MKSGKLCSKNKQVNILFACAGRRVALVKAFKQSAHDLKIKCNTFGADIDPLSPALYVCDKQFLSKPIDDKGYIPQVLAIVKKFKIDLIVPTIDTGLKVWARSKKDFEEIGAKVLVSSPKVIDVCQDKRKTYRFLREHEIGTPITQTLSEIKTGKLEFPVFLKPWDGSASRGNVIAKNSVDFKYHTKKIPNCIVQEYIRGQEYTCDVYVDFNMRVRCVVPRKRIQVRAGEVAKGQTAKLPRLMDQCRQVVEDLGAGPGVITIQCFLTHEKEIKFIEVNPRFGGGVLLSIEAGANFPKWILAELTGRKPRIKFDGWKDGLYMLRYDDTVWRATSGLVN